ncbi:MAG: response regulator transcription factor [bacterium]
MQKVLIIDDDRKLAHLIKGYLERSGYSVETAYDGKSGLESVEREAPDIVILDLMLPGLDGLEVCRRIRKDSGIPILILTARGEEADRVVGLELGADDYLTKPFSLRELVARIRAVLRRSSTASGTEASSRNTLRVGDLLIDRAKRELKVRGEAVELTATEFELLWYMASHPGRVFTREDLLDGVLNRSFTAFDRSVDMHISHLRQKIEDDPKYPRYIKTVWGVGYKFEEVS